MPKKLIDDVEDLLCATGQGQIETRFSVFAQSCDLRLGYGILPAGAQWSGKCGLFARGCFCYSKAVFQQFPSKSSSLLLEFNCPELKDNEGSLGVAE
jgi:hypothetical protein